MASFIEIRAQQKQRENQANAIEVLARQRLRQQQFERQKAQQSQQFGEAAGQGLGINLRALGRGGISTQPTTQFPEPPPQRQPETLEEIRAGIQLDPKAAVKRFLAGSTPPPSNDPALIKSFEITTSEILKEKGIKRGTQKYFDELSNFRAEVYGREQNLGRDPITGEILTMNTLDGGINRKSIGGELVSTTKARTPAADLKDLSVLDSLITQIGTIREIARANPDKIGPLEGRWNTAKIKFVEDADGTLLNRNVKSLIRLAYALSGKQISVQELKMLGEFILPSVNLPDANFMTALGFAEQMLTRDRKTRTERLQRGDYFLPDAPKTDEGTTRVRKFNPETGKIE